MANKKVIITVAQTGAFHGKGANPNLPEQPHEIAQSAYDCYNAGASIVHIHARDKNGVSTNDPKIYSEINSQIRAKCNIVLQNSTAPANSPDGPLPAEEGMLLLYADDMVYPEMCSLDCSLIATTWQEWTWVHMWTREFLIKHAARMKELGIKPELEMFNPTSIEDVVNDVYPKGVLDDPLSITFVMGMNTSQQAMPFTYQNLAYCISLLPPNASFTTMAIGRNQLPGTTLSLLFGGNMRVGFEDNIYYSRGELAKSNAQLVERAVRIAHEYGYEVATPDEVRERLKLKKF